MGLKKVEAFIECDGCNKEFTVELDTGSDEGIYDNTIATLCDQLTTGSIGGNGFCTYQQGMMLCPECTKVADNIGNESYLPSREEIEQALNTYHGV